jgi:uncharacterized membrane protein
MTEAILKSTETMMSKFAEDRRHRGEEIARERAEREKCIEEERVRREKEFKKQNAEAS